MRVNGILDTSVGDTSVEIAYTDTNPAAPTGLMPVVYLHEWGGSQNDFDGAASEPLLADRRRIAFDYPGHGDSPYPVDGAIGVAELVSIMEDLNLVLGLGIFALVGHGVGGLVATHYMRDARNAYQVNGLGVVEPALTIADCTLAAEVASGHTTRLSLAQRLGGHADPGYRQYAEGLERVDERAYGALAASALEACAGGDALHTFTTTLAYRSRLFVHGSETSKQIPYLDILRAHAVPIQEIQGSSHFPAVDNPEVYYRALGEFVAQGDAYEPARR